MLHLFMKGKFPVYLPWPFEKKKIFAIVVWSTGRDSTVKVVFIQKADVFITSPNRQT